MNEEFSITKRFWALVFSCCPFLAFTQPVTAKSADTLFCGDTRIIFKSSCRDNSLQKIAFVHVHEDETTAVTAVSQLFDTLHEECFVTWQCQQQRFVDFKIDGTAYHIDPNRIYTAAGINATLRSNKGAFSNAAADAVKRVADAFLKKYVDQNLLVVALHNNTNAGGLSVNSYKKGGVYSTDARQVFTDPKQDPDDFFYTTEASYFNFFKTKGFNIVLQDNAKVKDDGSLSVYCAKQKIPYINIEAQEGHLQQQVQMLKAVLELKSRITTR